MQSATRLYTIDTTMIFNVTVSILRRIMDIDLIRDNIMAWLLPIDSVNFIIGTNIRFSAKDLDKYTNPFKYFIPERRWLIQRMQAGYSFTVVSKSLRHIIESNLGSAEYVISSREEMWSMGFEVLLFVTKDETFVLCDTDFMPDALFFGSEDSGSVEVHNTDEPRARRVMKKLNGAPLTIVCPLVTASIKSPMVLNSISYWKPFHTKNIKVYTIDKESSYAHMTVGRCKIKRTIPRCSWDEGIKATAWSI